MLLQHQSFTSAGGHIKHAKDIHMQMFQVCVGAECTAPYSGSWKQLQSTVPGEVTLPARYAVLTVNDLLQ